MKSLSNQTIILSLSLSVIISFGAGYTYFVSVQNFTDPLIKEMKHKDTPRRLDAVKAVSIENIEATKNSLFDRLLDPNHYIKARAAEKCYRMGLSREIPSETIGENVSNLEDDTELTKRWLIANIIAINYESGFEAFARELSEIKSPFSRMFLVQILTIHGQNDSKARTFIEGKCEKKGAERAIARMVKRMLETDRSKWFKTFFPQELIIKEIPEKGKPGKGKPSQLIETTKTPSRKRPRRP
jgi:hypothetical protein